jgi:hypothetical protein
VASEDFGLDASAFYDNFSIAALVIGGDRPAAVRLTDEFDNGNRGIVDQEALYVHDIVIGPGSVLDLNGIALYYDGTLDNQGTILGGTPAQVP